jgi:hypothetical protein
MHRPSSVAPTIKVISKNTLKRELLSERGSVTRSASVPLTPLRVTDPRSDSLTKH